MKQTVEQHYDKMPIRVLWIAQSCSLQDEPDNPGLTGRMEPLFTQYCKDRVRLAVAYMADGIHEQKFIWSGIEYYAVNADLRVGASEKSWETAKAELNRVIGEFHPDLIQCFGSEWPYGLIAESVDIPIIIHMMGFLNIYYLSIHMARGECRNSSDWINRLKRSAKKLLCGMPPREDDVERCTRTERRIMHSNRFFFGRTTWDRNIVRYYSPSAHYFCIPEMIKPAVYDAAGQWEYRMNGKLRLFSLSSGDDRKGNEIILRTADLLKNLIGLSFEWKVAGHKVFFPYFEEKTGIRHEDVNIELLGVIGSEEIIEMMKTADLFIHPSIMDNSPHAVCEAQLVGCPVIASNVGGVPDLVKDGETGFLYPYNEPHTLAFRIANLYRDKELLQRISETEVAVSRKRHDPGQIARLMLEAYETIIKESKDG